MRFLGLELALFGVQRVVCHPLRPALLFTLSMSFEKARFGSADMIDRDDKSPHYGSEEHSDDCEFIEKGLMQ